jgi:hypothetical protein
MFDGGVNAFGEFFLNKIGFSPAGIPLAWAIKNFPRCQCFISVLYY